MKRRIRMCVALVLSITLLFQVIPVAVLAEEVNWPANLAAEEMNWEVSDGVLTISGSELMPDYGAADQTPWYSQRENITAVVVSEGITGIGDYAFSGLTALTEVSIGPDVLTIGDAAFRGTGLVQVRIPGNVWTVGDCVFADCPELASVTIEALSEEEDEAGYMQILGYQCFYNCPKLTQVSLPDTLQAIAYGAFQDCVALEEIALPSRITSLEGNMFWGCTSLRSVTLPAALTRVGPSVFFQCTSLETVELPASITYMDYAAFNGCTSLRAVELPNGITALGDGFFNGCAALQQIVIPETVELLGKQAFWGCASLKEIVIPNSVTAIGDYAFAECSGLQKMTIPASVTAFGSNVFFVTGDSSLVVTAPEGSVAYQYCVDNGIPVTQSGTILTLDVVNEDGISLLDGCDINWYFSGSDAVLATGSRLSGVDETKLYDYEVLFHQNFSNYRDPGRQTVSGDAGKICVTVESVPQVMVSGKIVNENGDTVWAKAEFTQIYNGRFTNVSAAYSGDDGRFSADWLWGVPTTVTLSAEGYYDKVIDLSGLRDSDTDLGTIVMTKVPGQKLHLSLSLRYAAKTGESAGVVPLAAADSLLFKVDNLSWNYTMTNAVVQYPYLYLAEGSCMAGNDLRITVMDETGSMTAEPVTVTLDENCCADVPVVFIQNGSVQVPEILGSGETLVMMFDQAGSFVCAETVSSGYQSPDLPTGSYQMVFMNKTTVLRSVKSLAKLDEMGLTADVHYLLQSVTIESGVIAELPSVTVPALDETALYYTEDTGTSFIANGSSVTMGKYLPVRLEYQIQDRYSTDTEQVVIELPEEMVLQENSLTLDGKVYPYSYQGNSIVITTEQAQGIVRFCVLGDSPGVCSLDAYLKFRLDGEYVTQPLGTALVTITAAKLSVPERTAQTLVSVVGTAMPGSMIQVYDNEELVGTTEPNLAGNWSLVYELNNMFNLYSHRICAVLSNPAYGAMTTETATLVYDSSHTELKSVTMVNIAHPAGSTRPQEYRTYLDFQNPANSDTSYTYWPGYPDFSFQVKFQGDSAKLRDVTVVTRDYGGNRHRVACIYDEKTDSWLGAAAFDDYMSLPQYVNVSYAVDAEQISSEDVQFSARVFDELWDGAMEELSDEQFDQYLEKAKTEYAPDYSDLSALQTKAEKEELLLRKKQAAENLMENLTADLLKNFDSVMEEGNNSVLVQQQGDWSRVHTASCGSVTEDDLIADGYEQFVMDNGRCLYQKEGDSCTYVAIPEKDVLLTVERADYSAESVALGMADSGIWSLLSVIQDGMSVVDTMVKVYQELTSSLDNQIQELTRLLLYYNSEAFRQQMELDGINMEDMVPKELETKLKFLKQLEKIFKALDVIQLLESIKDLYDYAQKLADLYGRVPIYCNADAADALRRDIGWTAAGLGGYFALSIYGSLVSLTGAFAAVVVNPWVGASVVVGLFAANLWAAHQMKKNMEFYISDFQARIKDLKEECDEEDEDDNSDDGQGLEVKVDPSGYVYEAVPSNRLEGVAAEVYRLVDGELTLWNAEAYDQVNPQLTDSNGTYGWDVPFGSWLVRYSKDGYLDADSREDPAADENGYLPVPPIQTQVNTGMVSTTSPEILGINIYNDQVQILFSQYMKPETVTSEQITVTSGGTRISGEVTALNMETDYSGENRYASMYVFEPLQTLSGSAVVTVNTGVTSYNGKTLRGICEKEGAVVLRPRELAVAQTTAVPYGGQAQIELSLLPAEAAAGQTVTIVSAAPSIANVSLQSVTLDENGKAVVTVSGGMPGVSLLMFSLEGSDLTAQTTVTVGSVFDAENPKCEKVIASVLSGSLVISGTQVTLSTLTEGADIYYTTNRTCPCVLDNPARTKYEGPITLTEDTFIVAYAVKEGFEDSATAKFAYSVVSSAETAILGADISEQTVSATICNLEQKNVYVWCAAYSDDDRMVELQKQEVAVGETNVSFTMNRSMDYVKLFVLDPSNTPLCANRRIPS